MKTTLAFSIILLCTSLVSAQVENDDMYFTKKDRTKLMQSRTDSKSEEEAKDMLTDEPVRFDFVVNKNSSSLANSGREINPEFIARSQGEMTEEEADAYFFENYQYSNQNRLNDFNSNWNAWNVNPLYNSNYFAPSINSWNSPFYSPFNDPFFNGFSANPWCNPFFQSGWSASFSFGWGNNWNYGWGNPYWNSGWGNGFGNAGWGNPFWNNGLGNPYWGNGFMGNNWFPGNAIVIVDGNRRNAVYGKRGARGDNTPFVQGSRPVSSRGSRVSTIAPTTQASPSRNTQRASSSRIASNSTEYYTPQWRRPAPQSENNSRPTWNQSGSQNNRSSTFENRGGSQRNSGSFSSPSQRSSSSFSTPSRSNSGSSGGGSRPASSSRGRGGN